MGKTVTLDSIREKLEQKYGTYCIDLGKHTIRMQPLLRLPREQRAEVQASIKQLSDAANDDLNGLVDILAGIIRHICETPEQADWLLEAVGDDGQMLQAIFEEYQEATGLGDQQPSES